MMRELQPGDPQLIGPYRLRGRLGAGGMGRVYLGLSPGGRAVAVKVIRADLAQDAEFRARFRREVAVARTVSGLFTAPVIDADVDGPVPWLATAYVPGPSLADAVSQHGPLPAASVLALGRGLAEALSAIHAAGVVHRDLKPANVLLAGDGPRVIDFGISRAAEASALTHTGLVVGSPGFMSPEQAEGREVGPPSDVFSLGAVLAFAATGRGPFGSGSTPALVYRVVHSGPQLDLMPAEVRSLAARCLAKDPALRPTAAGLLAAAASPAAGWLPEAVTRPRAAASLTMTAIPAPQAPVPAPPVPELSATGSGRPPRQALRQAWRQTWRRGRWRPLTATLILSGLIGAGATAAVTMTAGSAPARAAQSGPLAAPPYTPAPASTPASPASSAPRASSPPAAVAPQAPPATGTVHTPPPSAPPATMTPPASNAPPSPTTSPSTSPSPGASSSASSAPPEPAPASSASTSRAVY